MPVKSKVEISQNFVVFSEYMNFRKKTCPIEYLKKCSSRSAWKLKRCHFRLSIYTLLTISLWLQLLKHYRALGTWFTIGLNDFEGASVSCFQNCSDLLWEKKSFSDRRNFQNIGRRPRIFKKFEVTWTIFETDFFSNLDLKVSQI